MTRLTFDRPIFSYFTKIKVYEEDRRLLALNLKRKLELEKSHRVLVYRLLGRKRKLVLNGLHSEVNFSISPRFHKIYIALLVTLLLSLYTDVKIFPTIFQFLGISFYTFALSEKMLIIEEKRQLCLPMNVD